VTDPLDSLQSDETSAQLQQEIQALRREIAELRGVKARLLQQQLQDAQTAMAQFTQDYLKELEERKQTLQVAVDQLERRRERVQAEMRQSFAGVSQDLAIRVRGFQEFLVSSLQELVTAAEQLELVPKTEAIATSVAPEAPRAVVPAQGDQVSAQGFQEETRQIQTILDQYRTTPNYYGPPWQLRRTFEPVHAERVSNWFFTFGGRGAVPALSSRLQNILVASAAIAILRQLHGHRLRTLILADSPERLGDWRRGLQDCLGISRGDFGPERGVVLFESPESLAQRAERLLKDDQLPLILIDDSEEEISLAMLQFPLWLAFAPDPKLRKERSSFDWFE
jgi:hypothetical protein